MFGHLARLWGRKTWDPAQAILEAGYTVLDTELTGLDDRRDDIVSLGAVRMSGGRIHVGGTFQAFVKPSRPLDGRSIVIHGILPSQLEAEPPIEAVLPSFLDYAAGTVLVGHCVGIDLAFLNRDARRLTGQPLRQPLVDTLSLYGWLRGRHPGHPVFQAPLQGLDLFQLAKLFAIHVEQAHTALGDAYVTAQLFQRFLPLLVEAGVTQLGSLVRVADPLRQAQNLQPAQAQVPF